MNHTLFIYDKYKDLMIKPSFHKSRLDGEFLIVMNNRLETIYLKDIAKEMLLSILNNITVDELFNKFNQEYDIEEIILKSDIIDFIKDMQWKNILSLEKQ